MDHAAPLTAGPGREVAARRDIDRPHPPARAVSRAMLTAATPLVACLFLAAAQTPAARHGPPDRLVARTVVTQRLLLLGPGGTPAATFGTTPDGGASLSFYDARIALRVQLDATSNGSVASLRAGDAGTNEVSIHVVPNDSWSPTLELSGSAKADTSARVSIREIGPIVALMSYRTNDGAWLSTGNGSTELVLRGVAGARSVRATARDDGSPWLTLVRGRGVIGTHVHLWPEGSPALSVIDATGQPSLVITVNPDGTTTTRRRPN